jgi:hypothetical protein
MAPMRWMSVLLTSWLLIAASVHTPSVLARL